jgi:hypothetical protein
MNIFFWVKTDKRYPVNPIPFFREMTSSEYSYVMTIDRREYTVHEGNVDGPVVVSTIIYPNSNAFLRMEYKIVKEDHHIILMNKRPTITPSGDYSLISH